MKKAISPIIAVILLIVVALSLAGILLFWGSDFVLTNTSKVDDLGSGECVGAYLVINSCNYKDGNLSVNITNAGSIDFKKDFNFNVILIDADKEIDFSNLNVLNNKELNIAYSEIFKIEDYVATPPIDITLYSMQCPSLRWSKRCS